MVKINVKVKPNSKEQSIEKTNNYYIAKLKSLPKDNKANIELCRLLQRYFKKPVKIKFGFTSRNKIVEVLD